MREIKFRAWDEMKKVMHIDFQFINSGKEGNDWVIFKSDKHQNYEEYIKNPHFQQQLKVMQFTGLKDKNGKEIYEGDIVQNVCSWEVKFNKGCFCGDMIKPEPLTQDTLLALRAIKNIVVIGNIYENPELIKNP